MQGPVNNSHWSFARVYGHKGEYRPGPIEGL
jgi:hypothetical protein